MTFKRHAATFAIAASTASLLGIGSASAHYIGPAYLKIPGVDGGAKAAPYKGWVRTEAQYWTERPRNWFFSTQLLQFSGPMAPPKGANTLAVAIDKKSPAYKPMMERCRNGEALPLVTFAESSHFARNPLEQGPKPADAPDYYEYNLKNVRLTCPVAEGAPEQAFTLKFDEIEWTNYKPYPGPRDITAEPAKLAPAPKSGKSRTFVLTWISGVADSHDGQCPTMNSKPAQEDYYRHLSPERAAEQRKALAEKGGVDANLMAYRAPGELNATMLPGTVPDPGFIEPKADVVRGLNLDGDDGTGRPPAGIRKHRNFVAPWGEKGIDNQLFLIEGCVAGWRRKGFLPMISNDMRASGDLSILIRVSGIDDERNDGDVAVDLLYSRDPMRRDGSAKVLLADYTYRISDNPNETQHFARFKAKLVNGVVVTEPLDKMYIHYGKATGWPLWQPRMRIELLKDGTMKGVIGGYRDWREYVGYALLQKSQYENTIGYNTPGLYQAIRRAADGMQDPETGEYRGISAAFDIEGISAFVPPEHEAVLASAR
jgi:type VI protein secretion system component Hcp